MKFVFDFNCLPEKQKEDIVNYTLKQFSDFTDPLKEYNAVLILTADILDKTNKSYRFNLSFSSKYYSFTETSMQNDVYESLDRICNKLKKEQKKILWYLKKEKSSGS